MTKIKPIINPVTVEDVTQLSALAIRTFKEAFSKDNSEENMQEYIEEKMSEEQLISELKNPESAFFFASLNNEPAGYLKINFGSAQTESKLDNALEIERIYVLKDCQGLHIGQQLMQQAFDIAKDRNLNTVWLGVWEHNHKAIRFYEQYGFTVFDKHIFRLGDDEQTDLMMKLVLD